LSTYVVTADPALMTDAVRSGTREPASARLDRARDRRSRHYPLTVPVTRRLLTYPPTDTAWHWVLDTLKLDLLGHMSGCECGSLQAEA
jgi:hypothetical protein